MESQSPAPLREVTPEGNSGDVFCKCGEGWTCVITKSSGPDAGKSIKCGENFLLTIEGEKVCQEELKDVGDGACCKCGEGWSCVISKTQQPDAPKGCECSGPCTTAVDSK